MIDQSIKILVNDDLIARYRASRDLDARQWQDPIVRGYVVALSRQLTIACIAGWERTATDITATLARFEPLDTVREHDYGGAVLWICFNWYCVRDIVTTRNAIDAALLRWPDDERVLRMRERVQPAIPLLPKPGK